MRPEKLKSRIFVDGGDQADTRALRDRLGFLDGQTTNPSLIAKNPAVAKHLEQGAFKEPELWELYKKVVQELAELIPDGSISLEVYADKDTPTEHMLAQGRKMFTWIPNAHIKFPTTEAGLAAAEQAAKEGIRINMTLCFSQQQAAAVYAATRGSEGHFVSPFIGRLDDRGENGMNLIENIQKMYAAGDGHVSLLTASVRSMEHFNYALALESDIITAPTKILYEWAAAGLPLPDKDFTYDPGNLKPIPYEELDLNADWKSFDVSHPLTAAGIEKFSADWNELIEKADG